MAERTEGLNLVLLGKVGAGKSASGNTILGREAFKSKKSPTSVTQDVAVESGTVGGRQVTVYDTPGLFHTKLSEQEIQKMINENVLQRCESGPTVFLLAIKADRFTEEERKTVEKIEEMLGEERLKKTWILFTRGDQLEDGNMSINEFINDTEPLKRLVQKYNQRYHVFNNKPKGQVQELLTKIYSTHPDTKERGAKPKRTQAARTNLEIPGQQHHMSEMARAMSSKSLCEGKGAKPKRTRVKGLKSTFYARLTVPQPPMSEISRGKCLTQTSFVGQEDMLSCDEGSSGFPIASRRIVLLGKTGAGKSAAGNTILGWRFQSSSTKTETCELSAIYSSALGRSVSVVDTPGFFDTQMNPEELVTEIRRSVYISSPGPHAFLIVFRVHVRFTDREQQIPQQIEKIFGQEVLKYSIILFTHGDQLRGKPIEELIEENSRLRDVVDQCGGRYHVFNNEDLNNRDQVNDLLEKIDTMIEQNGGGHYSNQMYEDAQRFRQEEEERRLREEEEQRQREEKQRQEDTQIKYTEERIRAEFEGPPRFLQERLKAIRLREEDRKRRVKFKREWDLDRGCWDVFGRMKKQRQEEIERVIKETEERIRAEFEGPPRFLLERFKSMRLREDAEKTHREEIERVRKETEERVRAEFDGTQRLLQERFESMRLGEEEDKTQREEKQRQEEIERVIKETERRIRAEFEGPPRFLLERFKSMRLREDVEKTHREEIERVRKETEERVRAEFDGTQRLLQERFESMRLREEEEKTHREEKQRREEMERVRKETEEKIRAEFEGPPRFLQEKLKAIRLSMEDRIQEDVEQQEEFERRMEDMRLMEKIRRMEEKRRVEEMGSMHISMRQRHLRHMIDMERRDMEMIHEETQSQLQEEIERVIKEMEKNIRAKF